MGLRHPVFRAREFDSYCKRVHVYFECNKGVCISNVIVCCSVLQCVAVCCSVLQCAAVCCSVLQCVAMCCSVLQCAAVCCSVLQCATVCSSVLLCVAVCCSKRDIFTSDVLQCVAVKETYLHQM